MEIQCNICHGAASQLSGWEPTDVDDVPFLHLHVNLNANDDDAVPSLVKYVVSAKISWGAL